MRRLCLMVLALSTLAFAADAPIVRPKPVLQTPPMPHSGDSADDPAIWFHPTEPEKSLILGTDKQGGLHAYNMDGSEHQVVSRSCKPNNVDVIHGFTLGGRSIGIAVASTRSSSALGVKVWAIDPQTRTLRDITAGEAIPVFGRSAPYGACGYRSPRTGKCYVFVTNYPGDVEQVELLEDGGRVDGRLVRKMKLGSISEACVADAELGHFYVAQERVGVWQFNAEPDGGTEGRLIAKVGADGLKADVEGLAIYAMQGGKGYLVVSSQGSNTFRVYEREPAHRFLLTVDPVASGELGDVSDTDGIEVTSRPTSPRFPKGLMIVQDGQNAPRNQNFKVYDWADIVRENRRAGE